MRGTVGVLVGIAVVAVGLGGLGFALHELMSQTAPDTTMAVAGLAAFVVGAFALLAVIR